MSRLASSASDQLHRAPLLATKLFIPRARGGLVSRPRLAQSLAEALRGPLTLISAPAGFGKTTLLADWRESGDRQEIALGWVSLDRDDGDPVRFWTYFIAAMQTVQPGFGEGALAMLLSSQTPPASVLLPLLVNELAGLMEDVALVLDDYHVIDSPSVHDALAFLVDHLPPRAHLMVLTRADPPWPLARWRARGLLSELRASDLRFTPEEALAYLRETMGLSLSTADVATLEARTEGWIVGLQMAALSLKGKADASDFVRSFAGTNRFILEFLVEEVFIRQPEEVQSFLLRTSVLEQLTAPLCDAVLGRFGSAEMLEKLERDNLFLVPLDDDRRWYRYHHLFADLLRARLRQTRPDLVPELYSLAGEWCGKEGLIGEAMSYHLAAGNQERAAQLAEQTCLEMLRRSSVGFVPMAMKLADEVVLRRPWLAAFRVLLDIVWGRYDHARKLLREAEWPSRMDSLALDSAELLPFVRLMSAYVDVLQGADADIAEEAEAALAALPEGKPALRNTFSHWLGLSLFLRGDFSGAEEALMRPIQEDLRTGATNATAANLVGIVKMRAIQGRLREASDLCRQWLQWMDERGRWRFFRAGDVSICLGEIHREWNDLEEALALVDQGIKDSQSWHSANSWTIGYVARARVLAAMGQIEPGFAALHELEGLIRGLGVVPDLRSDLAACWADLYLAQGDVASAARWVDEGLLADGIRPSFRRERDGIVLARLLLARGEAGKALALLARMEGAARLGGRNGRLIEVLTLQAGAFRAQKEVARALSVLGQALTLGEPEGYARVFVEAGEPVADLLNRLSGLPAATSGAARFSAEYVARLLAAFGLAVRPASSIIPAPRTPMRPPSDLGPSFGPGEENLLSSGPASLIEPLSERELEVLRRMAAGLTNQQIAARLVVAPGTVKAHVHNICGKLGAQNRVHAIARATELQLL